MKLYIIYISIVCFTINTALAQEKNMYLKQIYSKKLDTLPYRILYPKEYNPSTAYPLLIMLHGSGERGNDNELQLTHGADLFLSENVRSNYPMIVVFPQCELGKSWNNAIYTRNNEGNHFQFPEEIVPNRTLELLEGLLTQLQKDQKIDPNKIYIGGLSMGGMGTFEMLHRNPNTFAAAFPICGGANPNIAPHIKTTPLWIFHGKKDKVVPPEYSTAIFKALKRQKADVTLTLYPEDGHDSWTSAFAEPRLLPWLFSKSR